jgi:hypothetical protein
MNCLKDPNTGKFKKSCPVIGIFCSFNDWHWFQTITKAECCRREGTFREIDVLAETSWIWIHRAKIEIFSIGFRGIKYTYIWDFKKIH